MTFSKCEASAHAQLLRELDRRVFPPKFNLIYKHVLAFFFKYENKGMPLLRRDFPLKDHPETSVY